MEHTITLTKLKEMLRDVTLDERDLRPYLTKDAENSCAFSPALMANPQTVDSQGREADIPLRFFNWISRKRREFRYWEKIRRGYDGLRIVSEGDSWFQYPILLDDVIDQLSKDYAIYSLGAAGDLLAEMIAADEITETIQTVQPHIFMISGGGNDWVGDGMLEKILRPYRKGLSAEDYPNDRFTQKIDELKALYGDLFTRLAHRFPGMKMICHGYDYSIPTDGKWLGKPLRRLKINNKPLQRRILRVLMDRYNDMMKAVAADFAGVVHYIDCRGTVGAGQWHDELHPDNDGFKAVAELFRQVFGTVAPRVAPARRVDKSLSPGREKMVADAKLISADNFRRLVSYRYRKLTGEEVGPVSDEDERRGLESGIRRFYEKVHKEADFLPARFLASGAERARAVCRIVTPDSYGTGFLIASRTFIMTNNHVIDSIATARGSMAEFGFEDGSDNVTRIGINPDRFFVTDETLDFTIVACDGDRLDGVTPIPLLRNPMTVSRDERVNIVQHPKGRKKEISVHDNRVLKVLDKVLHYRTDTQPGSSGSPVFNNTWDLVGLHHAGWADAGGEATNEGIRIAAIVAHLLRRNRTGTESSLALDNLLGQVNDTSPLLGFFDLAGVTEDDALEVEIPDFAGTPDFADVGFWNIEHFNQSVADARIDRVADVLSRLSMDAMGLVEVEAPAMERLVTAMRQRGLAYAYELLDVSGRQDLAVLYDTETTTVQRADDITERHRDALAVTTTSGRKAFPRIPLFARCQVMDGNATPVRFLMIVVHLKAFGDAQSRARRRLAASVLVDIIQDVRTTENIPVILGGDFNEVLNNDVLGALTDAPDLFALTADDAVSGAASYVGGSHRSLIDHIIISRDVRPGAISGDDAAIVRLDRRVSDFAADVSDHTPIVMRMVARGAPLDHTDVPDGDQATVIAVPDGARSLSLDFD